MPIGKLVSLAFLLRSGGDGATSAASFIFISPRTRLAAVPPHLESDKCLGTRKTPVEGKGPHGAQTKQFANEGLASRLTAFR